MKKTYQRKAPSSIYLCCNGIKCSVRGRCWRYNSEPFEKQSFISPIKKGNDCKYFDKMKDKDIEAHLAEKGV